MRARGWHAGRVGGGGRCAARARRAAAARAGARRRATAGGGAGRLAGGGRGAAAHAPGAAHHAVEARTSIRGSVSVPPAVNGGVLWSPQGPEVRRPEDSTIDSRGSGAAPTTSQPVKHAADGYRQRSKQATDGHCWDKVTSKAARPPEAHLAVKYTANVLVLGAAGRRAHARRPRSAPGSRRWPSRARARTRSGGARCLLYDRSMSGRFVSARSQSWSLTRLEIQVSLSCCGGGSPSCD
jgi:hypothetical protein